MPELLSEVSAIEIAPRSNIIWVIEDSGNKNHLYGLNEKGHIIKDLKLIDTKNNF